MNEEKRNRLIAGITVNVILLILVLVAVCIYQIVEIVVISGRKADLEAKIEYYMTETKDNNTTLEYFKSYDGLLDLAYEYGWVFPKE